MKNINQLDLEILSELVEWLNVSSDIQEFSLKYNELELSISRREIAKSTPINEVVEIEASGVPVVSQEAKSQSLSSIEVQEETVIDGEIIIRAPMVGTFYASPKPGADSFVRKGQRVSRDSTLCIIEVMKLMNHIEAGVEGEVVEIYVIDQSPVEYNQPIMKIRSL